MDSTAGIVLVDGNSLGYVCHCRSSYVQTSPSGQQVQSLEGFYERLWALSRQYPNHEVVVLWDDQSPWRNEFFPAYKQNRDQYAAQAEIRRQYKSALPLLQESLSLAGCKQITAGALEADDLASILVKKESPKRKVVLCSSDTDWWQLVSDKVSWQSCKSPYQLIELESFAQTGFDSPSQSLEAKVLTGDKADNIPGFKDIGPARAKAILARFKSLSALELALVNGSFQPEKWYENSLLESSASQTIKRNLFLMDLRSTPERIAGSNPLVELERKTEKCAELASRHASDLGLKNLSYRLSQGSSFFSWLSLHQDKAV